ncbi:MAG: branched-chain amino acid ABC transporter permease [Betaproteobacteria bacterium]|nr:branched-chain amino acid ABC transporter permease [Betaproteobacteria bacterium]
MKPSPRTLALFAVLALLAAVPTLAAAFNQPFYLDLFRRIMIFAIAAASLNLILGYGGMVSFGHAAYLGIGAYAVGVLAHHGIHNGWLQWAVAIGGSALVALVIGAVSIRTSGIYFIMITLAFTQMLYYMGISIEEYGGDDGIRVAKLSQFEGLIDLANPTAFYYVVLALLAVVLLLVHRLVNSRFGMVIRAAKSNDARTRAIGFSPYPYRLAAFVIAGAICGLAGALLVNQTAYLTPEFMNWTRSGELMFMVILGGIGTTAGPLFGAAALLLLEDLLQGWSLLPKLVHNFWQFYLGIVLVLVVLFAKRGLAGLLRGSKDGADG